MHKSAIRWRISASVKVVRRIVAIVLTISEILMFKIYDIENIGQGHEV